MFKKWIGTRDQDKVKAEVMSKHYCWEVVAYDGYYTFNKEKLMKHYCPEVQVQK